MSEHITKEDALRCVVPTVNHTSASCHVMASRPNKGEEEQAATGVGTRMCVAATCGAGPSRVGSWIALRLALLALRLQATAE